MTLENVDFEKTASELWLASQNRVVDYRDFKDTIIGNVGSEECDILRVIETLCELGIINLNGTYVEVRSGHDY